MKLESLDKLFLCFLFLFFACMVIEMGLKLKVDNKEIPLNEFVERIMNGTITGAVSSLKGIKDDWKKIEVEIEK